MPNYNLPAFTSFNGPLPVVGLADVNIISPLPVPVTATIEKSTSAIITSVTVTTNSTMLLNTNLNRKGLVIQTTLPIFLGLTTETTPASYSYDMPTKAVLELENYCGPITACTASGTSAVFVTEKL